VDEKSEQLKKERALLAAIRKGDPSGWGELYDSYAPLLYRRVLMPRLAHPTAAEDALSETFRTAIERFSQYQDQEAGIYPWLARIASNKAMDMHRARAVTGRRITDLGHLLAPLMREVEGADELLELKVEARALAARMTACLEQINPRYRRALELRFLEEKGREACADLLEVKVATFDVLVLRAVRALQKVWHEAATADG
jgi:RNA polymerase sigma factor (sigma-70 family)